MCFWVLSGHHDLLAVKCYLPELLLVCVGVTSAALSAQLCWCAHISCAGATVGLSYVAAVWPTRQLVHALPGWIAEILSFISPLCLGHALETRGFKVDRSICRLSSHAFQRHGLVICRYAAGFKTYAPCCQAIVSKTGSPSPTWDGGMCFSRMFFEPMPGSNGCTLRAQLSTESCTARLLPLKESLQCMICGLQRSKSVR